MREVRMPDWKRFRQALDEGHPIKERLRQFRLIEQWLDLPVEEMTAALEQTVGARRARDYWNAVSVVRLRLEREIARSADAEGRKRLESQRAASFAVNDWLARNYPDLSKLAPPGEAAQTSLRQKMAAIFPRLAGVAQVCDPFQAKPEHLGELEQILAVYRALESGTAPDNPALPELRSAMGNVALMRAKVAEMVGRNDDGRPWFEQAARLFEEAGEPENAGDCRARSEDLEARRAGDLDRPTERSLRALLSPAALSDPLERAAALVQLSATSSSAGDIVEAMRNADDAAMELKRLGYPDPLETGLDAALDAWITQAAQLLTGNHFLQRIAQVLSLSSAILGARISRWLKEQPQDAARGELLLRQIQDVLPQFEAQSQAADAELQREVAVYFPPQTDAAAPPASSGATDVVQRLREMDDALFRVREECNRRAKSSQPMDDLLEELGRLRAQAASLMPLYVAKVELERAYLYLHLGRGPELLTAARDARDALLAGRPAALGSLSQSYERALYFWSLQREAQAHIIMGDLASGYDVCASTIRDVEASRYRINSPFQQSAFLAWVADFYKWAAFAAFKLERWDDVLEATELMKARLAIRSRLAPSAPEASVTQLAKEFDETSAAFSRATVASTDAKDLATRRRWLWDMLAIARRHAAAPAAPPELRIANVQATLQADEAAIDYFWLNDTTLLVMLLDRERFHAQRIALQPGERQRLHDFVANIQQEDGPNVNLDVPVARLGDILFPAFCRDFVAFKSRLLFSPNHSLHVFPFHAARWGDEFLGTHFGVRYVPNLSSLLVPWQSRCDNRVLAIAVPECEVPGFLALRNAEAEVTAIRRTYDARGIPIEVLTGAEASRARLERMRDEGRLAHYRCVHLATHGVSVFTKVDDPLEAKLLLHRSQLDAMDIAGLGIGAEVVVLSACTSGQRAIGGRGMDELPGDDIFGLQSALFQSGVRSVLGALWTVDDESAMAIVTAFHQGFAAGDPPETALRSALRDYLRNAQRSRSKIYYWAPFFITSLGSMVPANAPPKEN
jgi:CHAT domain-containing protein